MRRRGRSRCWLVGLVTLCALPGFAGAAEAKGKVIASPSFNTPGDQLAPPAIGDATVSYTVTGKLTMRCFTSASSNGRKVKCSGAVRKTCVAGRGIDVYAPYTQVERQSIVAGPDGSFAATITSGSGSVQVFLTLHPVRTQSKGLRVICYPARYEVDVGIPDHT
jgi:hypothetical protein